MTLKFVEKMGLVLNSQLNKHKVGEFTNANFRRFQMSGMVKSAHINQNKTEQMFYEFNF
jgi:hypothetical protein